MVNGSLLAHGEVVVIDDEFGIRVSEIVTGDN
jgi:flagellar motor switch/type III secretory pathway protein FliN